MRFSTGDGFRLANGGVLSRLFWCAVVVNGALSLGQAFIQENREDQGLVRNDNMNFIVTSANQFFWRNPKWVVIEGYNLLTEPE